MVPMNRAPPGQHSELQPGAVASLQLKGEHVVLVEGPAGHLVAVQGDGGAACVSNQLIEQSPSSLQQPACHHFLLHRRSFSMRENTSTIWPALHQLTVG